jgi:hypothetical protein
MASHGRSWDQEAIVGKSNIGGSIERKRTGVGDSLTLTGSQQTQRCIVSNVLLANDGCGVRFG